MDKPRVAAQDEMLDNSSVEKTTSSPTFAPTSSHNSSAPMQLPVSLLAPSIPQTENTNNRNNAGPKEENWNQTVETDSSSLPGTSLDNVVSHRSPGDGTLLCESGRLTQPNLGQKCSTQQTFANIDNNNGIADEILHQIALAGEELLKLQAQIQSKGQNVVNTYDVVAKSEPCPRTVVDTEQNILDTNVTNHEYVRQNLSSSYDTQGIFSRDNTDVNSNMTVAVSAFAGHKQNNTTVLMPEDRSSPQSLFIHSTVSGNVTSNDDTGISPISSVINLPGTGHAIVCEGDGHLSLPVPEKRKLVFDATCESKTKSPTSNVDFVAPPVWTPLAMKSVACRDKREPLQAWPMTHLVPEVGEKNTETNKGLVPLPLLEEQVFTSEVEQENSVIKSKTKNDQTPPSKQQSAFRKVANRSGLSPSVGLLSLRGNSGTKSRHRHKVPAHEKRPPMSLVGRVLQLADERFASALLDDEVERFACRLVMHHVGKSRCSDPVAKILTEGDDMVGVICS